MNVKKSLKSECWLTSEVSSTAILRNIPHSVVKVIWKWQDNWVIIYMKYRQFSNIRRTLVGNKIVDNSDVVGASPVGAAPTTSSLST